MCEALRNSTMADQPPPYNEKAGYPPQGGQAPYPMGQAPYPTGPGQAPYPTGPGQAPYSSGLGQAPYPSGQLQYPPQPQPGYPQGQPVGPSQVQTTVIVNQPHALGPSPVSTTCPKCHQVVITQTVYESGTCTYLACLGICLIGCDLGCCLIPFCMDDCKDARHICPNCNHQIGFHKRL